MTLAGCADDNTASSTIIPTYLLCHDILIYIWQTILYLFRYILIETQYMYIVYEWEKNYTNIETLI